MQNIFIKIVLIPAFLFLSACAGSHTVLSPEQRTFKTGTVLMIVTKDRQHHHLMVKATDDGGIHGSGDKYILFEDILYIERRKGNPVNLAIAMLAIGAIAATAFLIVYLQDPYGLKRFSSN